MNIGRLARDNSTRNILCLCSNTVFRNKLCFPCGWYLYRRKSRYGFFRWARKRITVETECSGLTQICKSETGIATIYQIYADCFANHSCTRRIIWFYAITNGVVFGRIESMRWGKSPPAGEPSPRSIAASQLKPARLFR